MGNRESDVAVSQRYETIFSVFMLAVVFLYRHNDHLVFPGIFYLFGVLLVLNLAAGWMLRRWPSNVWAAVGIVLANCGIITAILSYSGGPLSNLWVLYLLPIYTVCLLLSGLQLALIVGGIISFNMVFYYFWSDVRMEGSGFDISLRTGLFLFAAAVTWKFAQKDRASREKLARQRLDIARIESELVAEHTRVEEAKTMADIGQLAAGISHDLMGPLTVALGTAKMMLEDAAASPFRADLERIVRAVRMCETISQNVLGFARNREMAMAPCDLRAIAESALLVYEPLLTQQSIRVERRIEEGLPPVKVSAAHIERIFLNLLSNARAAMKDGGTIRLIGDKVVQGPDRATWVRFAVEDTGPGLPDEVLQQAFKPFNTCLLYTSDAADE